MKYPRYTGALVVAASIAIYGCIGTTQPGTARANSSAAQTHSKDGQKSRAKTDVSCEPPELMTGDLATARTAPCEESAIGTQQLTEEPPEIHPN